MANRRRKDLTDIEAAKRSGAKALEDAKAGRIQREESENEVRGFAEIPHLEEYHGGNSPANQPSVAIGNSTIPVLGPERTVEPIGGNRDYSYEMERLAREANDRQQANLTNKDKEKLAKIDADMADLTANGGWFDDTRLAIKQRQRDKITGQNLSQNREDQSDVMDAWLRPEYKMTKNEMDQARQIIRDYENTEYKNSNVYDLTEDEQRRLSQINALRDKISNAETYTANTMNFTDPIMQYADDDFYGWSYDQLKEEAEQKGDIPMTEGQQAAVNQIKDRIAYLESMLNDPDFTTGDTIGDITTGIARKVTPGKIRRRIKEEQEELYKTLLRIDRGTYGEPDYNSYNFRKENMQKQNPVSALAGDLTWRTAATLAGQKALGNTGYGKAVEDFFGDSLGGKIATQTFEDLPIDIATDTIPELASNLASGMPLDEALERAGENVGVNTAFNFGLANVSNLGELIPALRNALKGTKGSADDVVEDIARQADIPKVDPAELAAKNEIDAAAKTDAVNEAVEEIENLSKQVPEVPEETDFDSILDYDTRKLLREYSREKYTYDWSDSYDTTQSSAKRMKEIEAELRQKAPALFEKDGRLKDIPQDIINNDHIPQEVKDYAQKRGDIINRMQAVFADPMSPEEIMQAQRSISAMDEYMYQNYPELFRDGNFIGLDEAGRYYDQARKVGPLKETENTIDISGNSAYAETTNGGIANGGKVDGTGNPGSVRSEESIPGGAELSTDMDGKRSYTGADGRTFNLRDVVDDELSKRMDDAGINNFGLRNTSGQTEDFSRQLAEAKASNKNGRMVSGKTPEELTDAILFSDDARTCGVAIEPNGNIVAVHKNTSNKQRGAVDDMLITARANGGDRLDCYGIGLVNKYEQDGFVPVARVEWNEKFKPDDWGDNPPEEIFVMMKDNRTNEQVIDDIKAGKEQGSKIEDLEALPYFTIDEYGDDAYDAALKYRDSLIDEAPGKGAFSNGGNVPPEEPPVDITRGANGEMKERGMSQHVRADNTPMKVEGVADEVQADFVDNPDMYQQLKNADTQALADDIYNSGDATISINGKVYSGDPETKFRKLLDEKNPAALPLGHQLAKDYSAAGNHDMAAQIYRDMGEKLTEAGQFTQASVLAMMKNDPLTALQYAQREIDAMNQTGAKKFGKKWTDLSLTPEEIQAFNSITPGDTEAIKALYDKIGARLGKEYPTTFMEKLLEGRKVAMLFNVRTNVRNVGANAPTLGMRWVADRFAALGEGVAHLINPNFKRTQAITGSGIQGRKLANEVFNSPKVQALVNGTSGKYEIPELKNSMLKDRQMFKGTPVSRWINKVTNGGIEKVNKKLFDKEGVESGLETIRNATYKMLDLGDSPFVKENFVERLGSYIHANKIKNIEDVPDDAIQMAWEEAMKATYKDNSWAVQMLQGIKTKGLEKIPGVGKPLGQAVIPFVQAPGNIAARMVDYSPIKATKGVADIIAGAVKKDEAAVRRGIDEAAKGLTGSGLIVLGMKLREAGLITGDYSDDKDQKNFEKQNGFIPWALHIGDKYFQYDWAQPFAEPIIVGTLLQDAISKSDQYNSDMLSYFGIDNPGLNTAIGVAKEGTKAAVNSWFDASPLQGLAELMKGGYNGNDYAQNIFDTGVGDFASALIPSLVNATAKTVDTTQRQAYDPSNTFASFVNQQKAKIPGLSDNLPTKYDTFGEEMKYADSKGEAFAQRFLIPGNYGTDSNDPVDVTINNLFNDTKDARVFPTTAPNSIGDRKLTAQESSDYQHDMGARSKEIAAAFIKSDLYKSMTNEERVNALNDIYGASKAITERDLFGKAVAQGNNYEKAIEAFDKDKTDGVIDYLSNKYNKYGIDAKAYKEMVANGEDLTRYEGYKQARESYGIDDSEAYREAYASGNTPEEKLANLDNEVQYQSTCKEYGLDPDGKATRLAWDSALHASADPVAAIKKAAQNKETALNTGFVTSDGKVNQPAYDKAVSVLGDDPTVLSNYVSFKNKAEAQNATSLDQYIPMLEAIPGMSKEEKGKYAALYKAPNSGSSAEKVIYSPYGYEGYYNYRLIQNAPDLNGNGRAGDKGDRIKYMYDVLKWDDTDDVFQYFNELDY